jgi:hypothetical protein
VGQNLRPEEERARLAIEHALGVPVHQFDDGSRNSMYDLQIHYTDGQRAAVEVTADTDSDSTELWRIVNDGRRWTDQRLAGGWMVSLDPSARAKRGSTGAAAVSR